MRAESTRTSRAVGRLAAVALAISALAVFVPLSSSPVSAASDRLRITFDALGPTGTVLGAGAAVADVSGFGNNGVVVTAFGGSVSVDPGATGGGAGFPNKCSREPCPNALVDIGENASLDPLTADFEWGARILMQANETDDGENVLQKGLYLEPGGQWKLQVDKAGGFPSCVVSGKVPGQSTERRVVLLASISVANGVWHQVTCRRTAAAGVQILVDGIVRGATAMPLVSLDSAADVSIGSKWVTTSDNDQFHGVVDDVFMTVLDGTPPPNTPPVAAFSYTCADLMCTFDGSVSTDNGPITYAWLFADGTTDTGVAPSHTFAGLGDHSVTLTVTDVPGLSTSITQMISIAENTAPMAAFTSTCADLSCTFDGSSSTDDGPLTYAWQFDDGATAVGPLSVHTFATPGDHVVSLTVTDGPGLTSTLQQSVTLTENTPPIAAFSSSCTGASCTFDASSSVDAGPLSYAWTFGDGGTASGVKPVHAYAASGTYVVTLTATDGSGAATAVQNSVTVVKPTVPGAPVIGTPTRGATGGALTAVATWSAPSSSGSSPITGYRVMTLRMSSSAGSATVLSTTTSAVLAPTVRQLSVTLVNGNYRFQVVAINAAGTSARSARSSNVVPR